MGRLEKIYDRAPIFLQNIMCTASGWKKVSYRYGKVYEEYRAFLKDFDTWPLEKQLAYQQEELQKFLRYTMDHSAYYAKLYEGIDMDTIRTPEDLKKLPAVDKEMLRANIDTVVTIPREGAVEGHTGGTTGKSLIFRFDPKDLERRMAMLDHFKARVGFEHRKMKRATFNGKHIVPPSQKKKVFWRYNAACKQMIYSSFHLTEDNIGAYVESLNKFKPQAIDGFFTSMCDVASYIERHNIPLTFRPVAIFPTSETLTKEGRMQLERVFGCKVYDQYASSEGAPFVTECPNQVLHMELASGVIEPISDDDTEVLVTSFTTHGTPLIRYRIGDRMKIAEEATCGCGLHGPIVEEIQGRRLDYLYTPAGAKINAGNVANLLKNLPNVVIRAQFRQEKMTEVLALLEVAPSFGSEHEEMLRDEFFHKFGADLKVTIQIVDEIPREKSGKFRMIVNTVDQQA